jgi:hypothetical protein
VRGRRGEPRSSRSRRSSRSVRSPRPAPPCGHHGVRTNRSSPAPTGLSGSTGPAGLSGPTGTTGPKNEPVQEGDDTPSEGADFSACKGLTGLDNAICRHEALLVVQPDNQGLQNSLAHLQDIKAKHEAKSGDDGGDVSTSKDGSSSNPDHGHGQSGETHGNAGGSGHGNGKDH